MTKKKIASWVIALLFLLAGIPVVGAVLWVRAVERELQAALEDPGISLQVEVPTRPAIRVEPGEVLL